MDQLPQNNSAENQIISRGFQVNMPQILPLYPPLMLRQQQMLNVPRENSKFTGWKKSTLPFLNPIYLRRLFDFFQKSFAIRTSKGLQMRCI